MGLFDFLKKKNTTIDVPAGMEFKSDIEKQMYLNNTMGYRDKRDKLDYQQKLLDSINKANNDFKNNGDMDALIKAYEYAFIESNPPCISSQNLNLADLYIKNGDFNKAWSYLNRLIATNEAPIEKVRHEQVRILKKEKKYIPATDMIMSEHLLKYSNHTTFNRNAFIKDAGVCTRALKWDESMLEDMADILESQLNKKDYDEGHLHDIYKKYLQSKEIMEG